LSWYQTEPSVTPEHVDGSLTSFVASTVVDVRRKCPEGLGPPAVVVGRRRGLGGGRRDQHDGEDECGDELWHLHHLPAVAGTA